MNNALLIVFVGHNMRRLGHFSPGAGYTTASQYVTNFAVRLDQSSAVVVSKRVRLNTTATRRVVTQADINRLQRRPSSTASPKKTFSVLSKRHVSTTLRPASATRRRSSSSWHRRKED